MQGKTVAKAFDGKFCNPLSPKDKFDKDYQDQLSKILSNRGLEIKQDLSFIKNPDTLKYVKGVAVDSQKDNGFQSIIKADPYL